MKEILPWVLCGAGGWLLACNGADVKFIGAMLVFYGLAII